MTVPGLNAILLAAGLAVGTGCGTVHEPESKVRVETFSLAAGLRKLSPAVTEADAEMAANAAVRYPLQLAREYRATPPAIFNNMLINAGIHPRGLCFQWADDLTVKLMSLHLKTLELHRGVARLGTRREHSCVVLTAPGQSFTNGIALDAWRYCGRLNWAPVTADKYAWQEVTLTADYHAELKADAAQLAAPSKLP